VSSTPEVDIPAWIIDDIEREQERREIERQIQIELDPTMDQPPPDEDEP